MQALAFFLNAPQHIEAVHRTATLVQAQPDVQAIQHLMMIMMAVIPLVILISLVVVIVPCWFLCKRAGFSPWLSLLNVLPFGTLVLLYILAFAEWPQAEPPINWLPPTPPVPPPPSV